MGGGERFGKPKQPGSKRLSHGLSGKRGGPCKEKSERFGVHEGTLAFQDEEKKKEGTSTLGKGKKKIVCKKGGDRCAGT